MAMSGAQDSPFEAHRSRLRDQLPLFWESYRLSRYELVEEELRRFLGAVLSLHAANKSNEENWFTSGCKTLDLWMQREAGLHHAWPEFSLAMHSLSDLETDAKKGFPPELSSQLSFCLGGIRRLGEFSPPEQKPPAPPAFPSGLSMDQAGEDALIKAVAGLRGAGAPDSPAQLLGRLESVSAAWWHSHLHLAEMYRKSAGEARRLAAGVRQRVLETVGHRVLPVLDALDAVLAFPENAAASDWVYRLRGTRQVILTLLDRTGVTPMEAGTDKLFDPILHQIAGQPRFRPPGRIVVAKWVQNGYRAGDEVIRKAEVEI